MEWWRHAAHVPTRDYFRVEDERGLRFWLYRDGLYGRETAQPEWFMHGMFA
jgi:protein ImuB